MAKRAVKIGFGPFCSHPTGCKEQRGGSKAWTTCYECDAGGRFCPVHAREHFDSHSPRAVICHIVTIRKPRKEWS